MQRGGHGNLWDGKGGRIKKEMVTLWCTSKKKWKTSHMGGKH